MESDALVPRQERVLGSIPARGPPFSLLSFKHALPFACACVCACVCVFVLVLVLVLLLVLVLVLVPTFLKAKLATVLQCYSATVLRYYSQ